MAIPPHRAAGEIGHIEDHNAIVDVLTGADTDLAELSAQVSDHLSGDDPHGDRAYADANFAPVDHTHEFPVTSVQGMTGDITLSAADVGAETSAGAQNKVNTLQSYVESAFIPLSEKGSSSGVAPLNAEGMIDPGYIPGFGGSSRVIASDTEPEDPNEGDIWINTAEPVPEPSPAMPGFYRTDYSGPTEIAYADLHPSGEFGSFPGDTFPPVTFTTGPTGFTRVRTRMGMANNSTTASTAALSYTLIGDGVDVPGGLDHGAYQSPRGLQSSAVPRMTIEDEWSLPPNAEITLTPVYRLSSLPSQEAQDGSDSSLKFRIDASFRPSIMIECW